MLFFFIWSRQKFEASFSLPNYLKQNNYLFSHPKGVIRDGGFIPSAGYVAFNSYTAFWNVTPKLLSICYEPGTIVGTGDPATNKTACMQLTVNGGRLKTNQINENIV